MNAAKPAKKTFCRISRKKKVAMKAKKRALEMATGPANGVDVAFLKCPACSCYFENPILLKCGHLVCKVPCGVKLFVDSSIECPDCHERTEVQGEQGIESLQNISFFSVVLAKLKSGVTPGIMPEFQMLSEKLDSNSSSEFASQITHPKLLPYPLDCLKEVILQPQYQNAKSTKLKQTMKSAQTMLHGKRANERFKQLMRQRAAKLITLPREDRESLMIFWSSRGVRFPPPPTPSVMDQLHERCKAQAKAFEIQENSKSHVPSLFEIQVTPPVRFGSSANGVPGGRLLPQVAPGNSTLLRPSYMYGNQSGRWNIENEETREEEKWVTEEQFGNMDTEMEDYYSALSDSHGHNETSNGLTCGPTGPEPFLPNKFERHPRPPFGPRNFRGMPPRVPPLMRPPPRLPLRMPFDTRGPHVPRHPSLPFGGPAPHTSELYQSGQSLGRQQYCPRKHDGAEFNPTYQQGHSNEYNQYHAYQASWAQPGEREQQSMQPPPDYNPETFSGHQIDAYATHQPNMYGQHQPQPAAESQTYSAPYQNQDQPQDPFAPQYEQYGPTQHYAPQAGSLYQTAENVPSPPTQSNDILVGSDFEVQQRWSQAMLNLHQGISSEENSAEKHVPMKSEDFEASERLLEGDSEQEKIDQSGSDVCDGPESTADELSNGLYDESGSPVTTTPHLCVGRLPAAVKPSQVRTLLAKYGKVSSCKLASNRSSTRTTYFAMVTMETVEAAAKCIRALNDSQFKGSKILVKKMKNNPTVSR